MKLLICTTAALILSPQLICLADGYNKNSPQIRRARSFVCGRYNSNAQERKNCREAFASTVDGWVAEDSQANIDLNRIQDALLVLRENWGAKVTKSEILRLSKP